MHKWPCVTCSWALLSTRPFFWLSLVSKTSKCSEPPVWGLSEEGKSTGPLELILAHCPPDNSWWGWYWLELVMPPLRRLCLELLHLSEVCMGRSKTCRCSFLLTTKQVCQGLSYSCFPNISQQMLVLCLLVQKGDACHGGRLSKSSGHWDSVLLSFLPSQAELSGELSAECLPSIQWVQVQPLTLQKTKTKSKALLCLLFWQ